MAGTPGVTAIALSECGKINSRWASTRAIAGAKLQSDLLVAIGNPQWRICDKQESAVREICVLCSTRRELETWHGRDGVTLADERARQRGTQTSTYTGAPVLDPTDERDVKTEPGLNH